MCILEELDVLNEDECLLSTLLKTEYGVGSDEDDDVEYAQKVGFSILTT